MLYRLINESCYLFIYYLFMNEFMNVVLYYDVWSDDRKGIRFVKYRISNLKGSSLGDLPDNLE